MAQNYLGAAAVPLSPSGIVGKLASFLLDGEVRSRAVAMLDRIDTLVVGAIRLLDSPDRRILEQALAGEVSRHEMGFRLANLEERLVVYKNDASGYEINPFLTEGIDQGRCARSLFGLDAESGEEASSQTSEALPFQRRESIHTLGCLAYVLFREDLAAPLKTGGLSLRARRRLATLLGGESPDIEVAGNIAAWYGSQSGEPESILEKDLSLQSDRFSWKVFWASRAAGDMERFAARAKAFMDAGFIFSPRGFERFFALASSSFDCSGIADTAIAWGILIKKGGGLAIDPGRMTAEFGPNRESGRPAAAIDGTGVVHLLPSASMADLLFLLGTARLVSTGSAWTFSIDRESSRLAFARGIRSGQILDRLGSMTGTTLPQTILFDVAAWEEEYESVRLYRGYVLALDRRAAAIVDRSGTLKTHAFERLADGVYFLGSSHPADLGKALAELGLSEPAARAHPAATRRERAVVAEASAGARADAPWAQAAVSQAFLLSGLAPEGQTGEDPRVALEREAAALNLDSAARTLADERIRRKLVYTPQQLRVMVKTRPFSAPGESTQASALDFRGKLRIIQAALKSASARLEIRRVSDLPDTILLARPVSLRKTERDYVLEAEDVARGVPVEIKVGAIAWIRLQRSAILGEET